MATEFLDVTRGDTKALPRDEDLLLAGLDSGAGGATSFEGVTKKAATPISVAETEAPLPSLPGVSRTPETSLIEDTGIDTAAVQRRKDIGTGVATGLSIGGAPTGQEEFFSTDSLIQILGAAGIGFLTAGPAGAIAAGLGAGLGAFLGTRSEKRRKKELAAKEARYQKAVQQQIAREDKFRRQERFDRLEQTGFDRQATKMKQQWDAYKDFNNQIMGVINNNAALKERFARSGF